MRKRIKLLFAIFVSLISFSVLSNAEEVTQKEAQLVAQKFIINKRTIQPQTLRKYASLKISNTITFSDPVSNEKLSYIVNLEPNGFIVISADKNIEPIIAYSFSYNWSSDTSCCNVLYHMLNQDMKRRKESIKYLSSDVIEQNRLKWDALSEEHSQLGEYSFRQWPEEGITTTGGWIETTWHQEAPYNKFCPLDPNSTPISRSVVGCVATTMSQIINYHKNINDFVLDSIDRYVTDTRFGMIGIKIDEDSLKLDFPSFVQINNFLDIIKEKYLNNISLDEDEIAILNFACGILLKMAYSSSSSGTGFYKMEDRLKNRLQYSSATLLATSEMEFYNRIKNNIMNALPVAINIISSPY